MRLKRMLKKGTALMMVLSVAVTSAFFLPSRVKAKTKGMVIDNLYYGSGVANLDKNSGNAYTAFGSPSVQTSVSAEFLYNKANGSKGLMTNSDSGVQTSNVTFRHANAYSIRSNHYASVGSSSTSCNISIVR